MPSQNNRAWRQVMGLLVLMTISGCLLTRINTRSDKQRLTIAVKQGVEGVALKRIARDFSIAAQIPVEVVELPYDELLSNELTQLKSRPVREPGKIPPFDLLMVDDPWLPSLVFNPKDPSESRLEDLTNDPWSLRQSDFFASTREVSRYCPDHPQSCDRYYAVPFVANSQLFAYRKKELPVTGAPLTWEQVLNAGKVVEAEPDRLGYVTRIGPGNSIVTDTLAILWAYDPGILPVTYESADPKQHDPSKALQTFKGLVGEWRNLGSASVDDFDVSAYLQKKRAAMGIVWSAWAMRLNKLSTLDPDDPDKLIFESVPYAAEGKPELGAWLLAIPKGSPQKSTATKFIDFATSSDQISRAFWNGNPPPLRSVLKAYSKEKAILPPDCFGADLVPPEIVSNVNVPDEYRDLAPAICLSLSTARPRPRTPCWKEVEQTLGKYLEEVITYDTTPDWSPVKEELDNLLDPVACQAKLTRESADRTGIPTGSTY